MPGSLFKEKQLRLCVVAALFSGTPGVADALILPPKPLESSASWDCRTKKDNDWLCQNRAPSVYSASSNQTLPSQPVPVPEIPNQALTLPVFRPEPIHPEREVPAGLPVSDTSESAMLVALLNSPKHHYVLQWLAANDRNSLEAMKQRYPILQGATIAHYRRSGKDWYVLLDGPYPDRMAAMAALSSSPRTQMARELYPWTRSIASIQRLDLIRPEATNERLAKQYSPEYPSQQKFKASMAQATAPVIQPAIANTFYPSPPMPASGASDPLFQESQPASEPLAYGQEFDHNPYQDYLPALEQQPTGEMYASIAPAYRSRTRENLPVEVDYNGYHKPEVQIQKEEVPQVETIPSYHPSEDVLNAAPNSYTIEWMSSSRRETLVRAQQRYREFRDTQILYYYRYNQPRYVLVSKIFGNRRDAVGALSRPSLSRVSARLSPRVRQIGYLQKLVDMPNHRRQTAKAQPRRYQKSVPRYKPAVRRTQPTRTQPARGRVLRYAQAPKERAEKPPTETIYSAPDNSYTIQWFAANNMASVEKMKQRFPELSKAKTVHFRRNNKDWYVLLQGQFKSSQEAIDAIKNPALKQAMLVLHPWTRPVNSLKKLQIVSR